MSWATVRNDQVDAHLQLIGVKAAARRVDAPVFAAAALQQPWINLRRGPLGTKDQFTAHRRPLNALLLATAVLFFAIAVACFVHGKRYSEIERASTAQIERDFRAQFPDWNGPIDVAIVE